MRLMLKEILSTLEFRSMDKLAQKVKKTPRDWKSLFVLGPFRGRCSRDRPVGLTFLNVWRRYMTYIVEKPGLTVTQNNRKTCQ